MKTPKKPSRVARTVGGNLDLTRIYDTVLREGEVDLPMETKGAAINLRTRLHRFRSLMLEKAEGELQELVEKGLAAPGTFPATPYDSVIVRMQDDPPMLMFRIRDSKEILSKMRRPDGSAIEDEGEAEELEKEAAALMGKLQLR